jgi:hypothetical protein
MSHNNQHPFTSTFSVLAATKAEWVAALRSGKFPQGYESLVSRDKTGRDCFCCLGVLEAVCGNEDIWQEEFPYSANALESLKFFPERYSANRTATLTATDNARAYSVFSPKYGWAALWQLNDNEGASFNEIADIIEQYVETH